jgi:transglutaminase-like putative cysteine protease
MKARLVRLLQTLPRDKADTLLLLGAAVLVLAPHAAHLPLWVSLLCGATLLWRAAITVRGTRLPPSLLLLPLAIASMAGIYATFHTLLGRDAGVAMLVLLAAFKMLEMRAKRDLFVALFLCFFLVLTNFLYSQSIATAALMVLTLVVLLTAQLSFQFTGAVPPLRRRLLMGAKILGLAAPLALLLFYGFPRIQGPLWGMPGDSTTGRSGLSNSMAPGNLSSLAQSEETAFRVKFYDPAPAQPSLYWRGIVLGNFDGRTWTQVRHSALRRGVNLSTRGKPVRHQVTLEPSNNRWLFALDVPGRLPELVDNASSATPELELSAEFPLDQRVRYDATSYPDYTLDGSAMLDDAGTWLVLPSQFNPMATLAGLRLREEPNPVRRVQMALDSFKRDNYVYTLEPPRLGRDSVDEFLYTTRAGFCEHYAGAFVFLMRAAGVPARVVTGYQGGEINPVDGFLTVRQSDAHAWAEVWLPRHGWLRVDPTAMVAPERVQRSARQVLPRRPPFGIEALGGLMTFDVGRDSWIGQLRFQWSAINNGWNQWVLNYNPVRQQGFLDSLAAAFWNLRTALAAGLMLLLMALALALRSRRQLDPIDALYSALCQQLARRGMPRARHEGPSAYAQRVAGLALTARQHAAIARFLQLVSAHKYGPGQPDRALAATLKRLLNESR